MTDITVTKVFKAEDRTLPVFEQAEKMLQRIRDRAFALSSDRGFGEGRALDDWLAAEREFCWPTAEFVEHDKDYALSVALPGFEPADIAVTATPRELVVCAKATATRRDETKAKDTQVRWSEFRSNDVYRRIALPGQINVDTVTAILKNGVLAIVAPKVQQQTKPVAVKAAA
ncbi:MAG TPA: Hsp20/alpha crystallin family protein [Steroidobacteraceae bacterium]|nr:Hsp20/alpha crystallin family protein [Steroidobacteraceae bacterium]